MTKIALATLIAASLASPALADHHADGEMRGFDGVYGGSYTCTDGEHGFYLDLAVEDETDSEWLVSGVLGFYPTLAGTDGGAADVAGSFEVSGTIAKADNALNLTPTEWLVEPPRYGAAEMTGTIAPYQGDLWQITGTPVVPGAPSMCSALIATQFLPAMDD